MVKITSIAIAATIFAVLTSAAPHLHPQAKPAPAKPAPINPAPINPAPVNQGAPAPIKGDWRTDMLRQVNAIRARARKPALILDNRINLVAQRHSDYQYRIRKMTHDDANGTLGARITAAGFQWRGIAENCMFSSKTVSDAIRAWVNSPPHYSNMLGDYKYVGFGESHLFWTQNFAK